MDSHDQLTVLYVDDEFASSTARAELLAESRAVTVVPEISVSDGLGRLSQGDIDCVLSDLEMPDRDGLEFLSRVRTDSPEQPFILFTGTETPTAITAAIEAGVSDYIPKSLGVVSYELLVYRIKRAVEHHRLRRQLGQSMTDSDDASAIKFDI